MSATSHPPPPTDTPAAPRRLVRFVDAAVATNILIVFTGGLVRVTGSGLGCPDWPLCDGVNVAPVPGGDHAGWQAAIEFGNRLLTFVVLAAVVAVVWQLRRSGPYTTRLTRLAWLLPAGVLAQAIVGGVTVLTGLSPFTVAVHFLLSMALIAVAIALRETVRGASSEPVGASFRHLSTAIGVVAAVVLVLGTVVTAAGPHGGDPSAPRLDLDIRLAALAHADAVWLLVGLTIAMVVMTRRHPSAPLRNAASLLIVLQVAQGAIGYSQYALGIPPALVSLHILGAALMWATVVTVWMRSRPGVVAVRPPADGDGRR